MKRAVYLFLASCLLIISCTTVDVFEKNIAIPGHEWRSSFKPEIVFDIKDSIAEYNIFAVVRHSDAYRYKNLWMNVYIEPPGDTIRKQQLDLQLATDDKGWLGSGMDDLYEHRVNITAAPVHLKAGAYHFRLENIMREDPLEHVMNVGIRVEKVR